MSKILGIDLGTTKSVVGIIKNCNPYIIPDESGNHSLPSCILVTHDDEIYAGWDAKKHSKRYQGKNISISSIKRLMGKKGKTEYGWLKTYPQEISAFILKELKDKAEKHFNEKFTEAVIAIPAHFDENQRRATKEAARIAGLKPKRLLNEATAAAICYSIDKKSDETLLVFDFGGGTLDVSIVETGEGVLEVISIEGDSNLGGDDFDNAILNYILDNVHEKYKTNLELNNIQKMVLKEAAEAAKIELTYKSSANIHIPGFLSISNEHLDLNILINREEFEDLSQDLVNRAIGITNKAIKSAKLKKSDIDKLILLGGCSRLPMIRESIKNEFKIKKVKNLDIETSVAKGATIMAGIIEGSIDEDIVLLDATPRTYSIETLGGVATPLIERNTTIPTKKSQIFSTTQDNQNSIEIHILQGEHPMAEDNKSIGRFYLDDIPPAPKGVPQIEVTFDIEADGVLNVFAKDKGTGKEQKITARSPYGLNETQIRLMTRKCDTWFYQKKFYKLKSSAEELLTSIKKLLKEKLESLTANEISNLEKEMTNLENIIFENNNEKLIETITKTRDCFNKIESKLKSYERFKNNVLQFIEKLKSLSLLIKPNNEQESRRLTQGSELLREYLDRKMSITEFEEYLLPVKYGYYKVKADLISDAFEELISSDDFQVLVDYYNSPLGSAKELMENCKKLSNLKEVHQIINLLDNEDSESREQILQRFFDELEVNSIPWAFFILIISTNIDYDFLSKINRFSDNDQVNNILISALIFGLKEDSSLKNKKISSKLISEKIPDIKYMNLILDLLQNVDNDEVEDNLINYFEKQQDDVFRNYFLEHFSDLSKIKDHKSLLIKLLDERWGKLSLFSLENIDKFPITEDMLKGLHKLSMCNNDILKNKSFKLLINYNANDKITRKIFSKELHSNNRDIRLLCLDYIKKTGDKSQLDDLVTLFKNEKDIEIKKEIVKTIAYFQGPKIVNYLIDFLHDQNPDIKKIAINSIEKKLDMKDKDNRKLLSILKKIINNHSPGIMDKMFLKNYSKNHPEMKGKLPKIISEN